MSNYLPFPTLSEEGLKYISVREEDVILLKKLKNVLVRSQLYAEAAYLRDLEKRMIEILDTMGAKGYKPKPMPESEEKVYSIDDVTHMLNLATSPLKKTIQHYEELSRTAIIDHVAGLMKINEELRKNQKDAPAETDQVST